MLLSLCCCFWLQNPFPALSPPSSLPFLLKIAFILQVEKDEYRQLPNKKQSLGKKYRQLPDKKQSLGKKNQQLPDKKDGEFSKEHEQQCQSQTFAQNHQPLDHVNENNTNEDIVPIVIRPGHIRFEPLEKGIGQRPKPYSCFICRGICSISMLIHKPLQMWIRMSRKVKFRW